MNGNNINTFGQLGQSYLQYLLNGFQFANTLVDIFDRYKDDFVKSTERARRAAATGNAQKVYQVIEGLSVPVWKYFLSVTENKHSLIKFFGRVPE